MANFFHDNDDLLFYFDKAIDWAPIVEATEYGYRAPDAWKTAPEAAEFYREMTSTLGKLAADVVAPRAAQIDREHPRVERGEVVESQATREIFESFKSAELHRLCLPRELGGLNVPLLVYFLGAELLARADVSTMTHFSFHGGMAMAMLAFSVHEGTTELDAAAGRITKTRFADFIEDVASGDAWGCMDITEPDAGSDMGKLRTRATLGDDGVWRVTGPKIFITSGHGKYHFVIARTEDAKDPDDPFAGLAGLSMFLVKAYEDRPDGTRERWVTLERVEDKLGHQGSVTAALQFENAPAELIGKRGEGFKYMLVLMNNARVGVGFEAIGLAESAHRMAAAYAETRASMGKPIGQHEMIADWLDEMRTDIQGLRALAVTAAACEEVAQKLSIFAQADAAQTKRELPALRARSRRLTPLLKYLAAEKAVEIARRNLQIHGGLGYTKECGAEKLLRDALVLPIYEGTSQIQSLMAMKDTLVGIAKNPRAFVTKLGQARWRAGTSRDPLERAVARLQLASLSAQQHLLTRTAAGKLKSLGDVPATQWAAALTKNWNPKRDFARAMLHAERLTRLLADEAIAEILLEQAKKFPERRELALRWVERAEPRSRALVDEITTTGDRVLASLARAPAAAEATAAE